MNYNKTFKHRVQRFRDSTIFIANGMFIPCEQMKMYHIKLLINHKKLNISRNSTNIKLLPYSAIPRDKMAQTKQLV